MMSDSPHQKLSGAELAIEVREALDWAGAPLSAHNALDSLEEALEVAERECVLMERVALLLWVGQDRPLFAEDHLFVRSILEPLLASVSAKEKR